MKRSALAATPKLSRADKHEAEVTRIVALYESLLVAGLADSRTREDGFTWYSNENKEMKALGAAHAEKYPHMTDADWAAFMGILSANTFVSNWDRAFRTLPVVGLAYSISHTSCGGVTFKNQAKAARILDGEAGFTVLTASAIKTYNFALDILFGADPTAPAAMNRPMVTIDTHMFQAAGLRTNAPKSSYLACSDAVLRLAVKYRIPPMVAQAIIWIMKRGKVR